MHTSVSKDLTDPGGGPWVSGTEGKDLSLLSLLEYDAVFMLFAFRFFAIRPL